MAPHPERMMGALRVPAGDRQPGSFQVPRVTSSRSWWVRRNTQGAADELVEGVRHEQLGGVASVGASTGITVTVPLSPDLASAESISREITMSVIGSSAIGTRISTSTTAWITFERTVPFEVAPSWVTEREVRTQARPSPILASGKGVCAFMEATRIEQAGVTVLRLSLAELMWEAIRDDFTNWFQAEECLALGCAAS